MGSIKIALRGDTYARALANAAQRAGRDVGALQPALSSIAAQPQARLRPGLSSFVREPGALPMTPQRAAMQDLARRMPWAGDEHTSLSHSSRAEERFNRLLDRRGLSQQSPDGGTQRRITESFGDPLDFRSQLRRQDVTDAGTRAAPPAAAAAETGAARPMALRRASTPRAPSHPPVSQAPAQPAGGAHPRLFPRARFQAGPAGKLAGLATGLERVAAALPLAAGVGIPLAVGGGMLLRKPGIRSNVRNLLDSSKGTTQEQDLGGAIPEQALGHADAIHRALVERGLDLATMRIGVDAPPGSGKTTLARALAQRAGMRHYGLDWEPGNAWKSTIGLGRNVEKTPHAPRAGEILEHYLLNRTHDPDLFDAQIHIRRDPAVIREQLTRRGNAAYISDTMDLEKSLGVADLGFDTLGGEAIDIGDGVQLKLRPREGWGNALDEQLAAKGIDASGLTRHEKLLSLHAGKRTSGAGWTPYVKNPFSSGETLALGASIPLGVMAARALSRAPKVAMTKEGIGARQRARMRDALLSMRSSGHSLPKGRLWESANRALTPYLDEKYKGLDRLLSREKEQAEERLRTAFSPAYDDQSAITAHQRSRGLRPDQRPNEVQHAQRLDEVLLSGRHDRSDIVDMPFDDDPTRAEGRPGVLPDRIAWRGGKPDPAGAKGPRWFSGMPSVSGGYVRLPNSMEERRRTPDRLTAHAIGDIPDGAQGPWTPHIGEDPRGHAAMPVLFDGGSPVGRSHIYEKVIDAEHVPPPLASYRPALTPGRFVRESGPNLLRGELPAQAAPHADTASALRRMAPALADRLEQTGALLKRSR